MFMIEIHESKFDDITHKIKKGLKYLEDAFECMEELKEESRRGERQGRRMEDDEDYMYRERQDYRSGTRKSSGGRYDHY